MIISASRRTDIPAFYSEWFENRVKAGSVDVRNPFNRHQVSRVRLSPDVVDCIVFWTKNPAPMLPRLSAFSDFTYYFQFTLTGYGSDIEGNLPDKKGVLIPAFQKLAGEIGSRRVIWRYDPILINEKYTAEYHLRAFARIAEALEGCTEKCVISFVDIYRKNAKNMAELNLKVEQDNAFLTDFAGRLCKIASEHGMRMASCAEAIDLESAGIAHNACIGGSLIEELTGRRLSDKLKKDPSQRPECRCLQSIDVGAYNTCRNGCRYCYANFSPDQVARSTSLYDPDSPLLCDSLHEDDPLEKVTERSVQSFLIPEDEQLSFPLD